MDATRRALLVALLLVVGCGARVTTPWPTAAVGVDLAGQPVRLDARSPRPVVLVFWATWCGHCKALLAEVDGWRAERAFDLIAVNVGERAARVRRARIPGRIVLDVGGEAAAAYDGVPVPTAVVVAGGRLYGRIRGRSRGHSRTLRRWLDEASADSPPQAFPTSR